MSDVQPIRTTPKYFDSWEDACRASKHRKAIANIAVRRHGDGAGTLLRAEVVITMGGEAHIQSAGIHIARRKATSAEVDQVRRWKPW